MRLGTARVLAPALISALLSAGCSASVSSYPSTGASASGSLAPVRSWTDFDTELETLAPHAGALVAELDDGRCGTGSDFKPVDGVDATRLFAIGPSSRVFILGELAAQIAAREGSWSEGLIVRDDWKSLPLGKIGQAPAGSSFSLEEYAKQMMVDQDSSATDHLLHRLTRERVEAYLATAGMADPSSDIPFLTRREMLVLNAAENIQLADAYAAGGAAQRRALLNTRVAAAPLPSDLASWRMPHHLDSIGWFATETDLCYAMLKIRDLAGGPGGASIMDMLATRPGVQVQSSTWPYVGFIGGSQPGITQLTWLLRRSDQRWFVISLTLNDPNNALPHSSAPLDLAQAAMKLLAETP
jgi:beta-lactamase class A